MSSSRPRWLSSTATTRRSRKDWFYVHCDTPQGSLQLVQLLAPYASKHPFLSSVCNFPTVRSAYRLGYNKRTCRASPSFEKKSATAGTEEASESRPAPSVFTALSNLPTETEITTMSSVKQRNTESLSTLKRKPSIRFTSTITSIIAPSQPFHFLKAALFLLPAFHLYPIPSHPAEIPKHRLSGSTPSPALRARGTRRAARHGVRYDALPQNGGRSL